MGPKENPDDFTNPESRCIPPSKKGGGGTGAQSGGSTFVLNFESGEILWLARKKPSPGMWGEQLEEDE